MSSQTTTGQPPTPDGRQLSWTYSATHQRRRKQELEEGTWAPFTQTGPVREHLAQLRKAGMSLEHIAAAAAVSVATLSRLGHADRMSSTAAGQILALTPQVRADAVAVATNQLRELVDDGWTPAQLRRRTGLSAQTIGSLLAGGRTVATLRTLHAVQAVYEQLGSRSDQPGRPEQREGISAHTGQDLVDDVAIHRAVSGDRVPLTRPERHLALHVLAGTTPDAEIGSRLGISGRTVARNRATHHLPPYQAGPPGLSR